MYSLNWNSYKSNICKGFAELQQREEFVDMTLVAEGHLVKVHKNLISLASPYIKNVIKSVPCTHPIIFLANLTHEVLCQILEYVYTGEVHIDSDKLDAFIKASKELQLPDLESYVHNLSHSTEHITGQNTNASEPLLIGKKINIIENRLLGDRPNVAAFHSKVDDILDTNMPLSQTDDNRCHYTHSEKDMETNDANHFDEFLKFPDSQALVKDNIMTQQCQQTELTDLTTNNTQLEISLDCGTNILAQQYTVSNKGYIQMILNRYLYSMHHSASGGVKRRWRCIDYRLLRCGAYVDTVNDKITGRKNCHTHPYHDNKIIKKIKANLIFGALKAVIQESQKINDMGNEVKFESE